MENLSAVVDTFAVVRTQIDELRKSEALLKQQLIESGVPEVDSDLYHCTVLQSDGRNTIDWKAVAMTFKPSQRLINQNTKQGDPFYTVRLSGR